MKKNNERSLATEIIKSQQYKINFYRVLTGILIITIIILFTILL